MATWYINQATPVLGGNGSLSNPWNSITGVSSISSNDKVFIYGGNYIYDPAPGVGDLRVQGKTNITFAIATGATGQAIFNSINLFGVSNTGTIDGIKLASGGAAILGTDGNFYPTGKFSKNIQWFRAIGYAGFMGGSSNFSDSHTISIRNLNGFLVRGVEVEQTQLIAGVNDGGIVRNGIAINGPVNTGIIEYNYVHDIIGDGLNLNYDGGANTFHVNQTFNQMVVRYNVIQTVGDDVIQGGSNSSYYGNFMDAGRSPVYYGGHPDAMQASKGMSYITMYNNIMMNAGQNPFIEDGDGELYVVNNFIMATATQSAGGNAPGSSKGICVNSRGGINNLVSGATFAGSTATVVAPSQRLIVGMTVQVTGVTGNDANLYNGTFSCSAFTQNSFSYVMTGTPVNPATGEFYYGLNPFGNIIISNNLIYGMTAQDAFNGFFRTGVGNNVVTSGNVLINCQGGCAITVGVTSYTDNSFLTPASIYYDTPNVRWYNFTNGNLTATPILPRFLGDAINAYPGVIDIGGFDFHPASGTAPIVGLSADLSQYGFTSDFDGNPRPSGSNWTAGPYEWQGNPITGSINPNTRTLVAYPHYIGTVGTNIGAPYDGTLGVMVVNADPGVYTITASGLPAGLYFDTGHSAITGSPDVAGTFLVTLSAFSGAALVDTCQILFPIAAVSLVTPAICSPLFASGHVGQIFTYHPLSSHAATGFTVSNLPPNLVLYSSGVITGSISGIATSPGTTQFTLIAIKGNGLGTGVGTGFITFSFDGGGSGIPPMYRRWGAHPQFIIFG